MSRPRDLVGLAMGNVHVPVSELTTEERLRLFHVFAATIGKHYSAGSRGGSTFKDWQEQTLRIRRGINNEDEIIESCGFRLPNHHMPWVVTAEHRKASRIAVLTHQLFRLPGYGQYFPKHWLPDERLGFSRLSLTQDGLVWFEWFETTVDDKLQSRVDKAEYQVIPVSLENPSKPLTERLGILLEVAPGFIDRFFHGILELIDTEARMRESRAQTARGLSNRLSEIGKMFDISITRP